VIGLFHSITERRRVDCSVDEALDTLVKAYRSVSEREIGVGDKLVVHVAKKSADGDANSQVFVYPLKLH
jgi:20S proteasome alpha/beta subunit